MPELKDTIAAFLAALTRAQHDANRLSKKLSERYRHDTVLRYFPVPNALLDNVEAVLRFAVVETAPPEAGEAEEPGNERLLVDGQSAVAPALKAARAALGALADELSRGRDAGGQDEFVRNIASPVNVAHWARLFATTFRELLQARVDALLGAPSDPAGRIEDRLRAVLSDAIQREIDASPRLDARAGLATRLATQAWHAAEADVAALAGRIADEMRDEGALAPGLDVELVTANTSRFPDYALHTLKIHARLRNYKWVIVDKASDQEELLPTD